MFRILVCVFAVAFAVANADKRVPIYQMIDSCLTNISRQSIDVVVDIAPPSPRGGPFGRPFFSFMSPDPVSEDVADFVEDISRLIPSNNFFVVVVNGTSTNQMRYYLNIVQNQTNTNESSKYFWDGFRQPKQPTIKKLLLDVLKNRTMGTVQGVPTSKNPSSPTTGFTVVITDGFQQTPLSSFPDPNKSVIIDLSGNFTLTNKDYAGSFVLLSREPDDLEDFEDTIRLQICHAITLQNKAAPNI